MDAIAFYDFFKTLFHILMQNRSNTLFCQEMSFLSFFGVIIGFLILIQDLEKTFG